MSRLVGQVPVLDGFDPTPGVVRVHSSETDDLHLGTAWLCSPALAITAFHVVSGSEHVQLRFTDGHEVSAQVVDADNKLDVALLRIEAIPGARTLLPLAMNDDGDTMPGDEWRGFGYPIGWPMGFPVDGVVSSTTGTSGSSRVLVLNSAHGPKDALRGLSGGPVLDRSGAVIGIITDFPTHLSVNTLHGARLDDAWAALPEWRRRMPTWTSEGAISRYLRRMAPDWNRPTYETPFRRRVAPPLLSVFVAQRFRRPATSRYAGPGADPANLSLELILARLREDGRHVILRGDPGTGKSVLLRWLCAQAARTWAAREDRRFVPVLVHASSLIDAEVDSVAAAVDPLFGGFPPAGVQWLVLVDGLDEIVNLNDRRIVVERIKLRAAQARSRARPPLRILVASRPLAILDEMPDAEVQQFVVQPFSPSQLQEFANKWFREDDKDGATAAAFLRELEASRLEGLASVPALATLAAVVYDRSPNRSLPHRRSELFDRFIELMLEERNEEAKSAFVEACEAAYLGRGESLAAGLWSAREELATDLARQIQEGSLSIAQGDMVGAAVKRAVATSLMPKERDGSAREEATKDLMMDLLLSSGLFSPRRGARSPLSTTLCARR
jgi:hypothetical protein